MDRTGRWTITGRWPSRLSDSWLRWLLAIGLLACAGPGLALDPDRLIAQYKHTRWTKSEGAPYGIVSIAQTRDGYLWLASNDGLFRFDGITFERIDTMIDINRDGSPYYLLATRQAGLWVYYHKAKKILVYDRGRFRSIAAPVRTGTTAGLIEGSNGDVWLAGGGAGQPLYRHRQGRWTEIQPLGPDERDTSLGLLAAPDGSLWAGYTNGVYRATPGSHRFEPVLRQADAQFRLALDPRGRVWATGGGVTRPLTDLDGRLLGTTSKGVPSDAFVRRGRPIFDREGNLWIARRKDGLERVRLPSIENPAASGVSEYRFSDGLTSDAVSAIFEDREGNIWVGTSLGLDRFRSADIASEPQLEKPAAYGDILYADRRGIVYVGQRHVVYRIRPGSRPEAILTGVNEPEAICEGPNDSIWVALDRSFAILSASGVEWTSKPDMLQAGIKGCGLDRWGRFWVSADQDGLFRREGGQWQRWSLPRGAAPTLMVRDRADDLWAMAGGGRLIRFEAGGPRVLTYGGPKSLTALRTMAPARDGLLLASEDAIGWFRQGRLRVATADQFGTLFAVNGTVQTARGETWLFGRNGLSRMPTEELERAFADGRHRAGLRTFDFLDGLIDSNAVRTQRTLVEGGDGRLWATTATGTVWLDPKRLTFNPVPPKVAVRFIQTGERQILDPTKLRLEAGSSDLTIGFAVLSLRMPERSQVRYRLEGQDAAWIDPGIRRQAFYTNLAPGTYRFRVIAANENGIWNRDGATVEVTIPPTFLQSTLFKLLLAALGVMALAALYLMRTRQLTARLQNRFDIRIAERERIARELHDTLLQGFQGLLLQFKAVTNRVANDEPSRAALDKALERAQQVLVEGRDRVRELRTDDDEPDFAESMLHRAERELEGQDLRLVLTQEGTPRPLHPLIQQELRAIVEEAVRNSARHARASTIEILVGWGRRSLRLAVRDDGVGLSPAVLARGNRPGHFGLVGMRERAERMGAKIAFASRAGAGLEIAMELPAHAAYRDYVGRLVDRVSGLLPGRRDARSSRREAA
jgi:signal transduction histidine kinase/ligand-binding sensor domain-containing protein